MMTAESLPGLKITTSRNRQQICTTAAKQKMNKRPSLVFCVIMDLIGYATYTIPVLGEFADLLWAPLSGAIFFAMFGGWKGALGGVFNFLEELLPGTDFIPSFTLMWILRSDRKGAGAAEMKAART